MNTIPFRDALKFWFKLGFISFGGPAGQIALMHKELVETRRWISDQRFLHALNFCMLLPGPEAQQLATYLGWLMHRSWGGILAGALFVLPSLLILIGLSWLYVTLGHLPWMVGLFDGIKSAIVVIVVHAVYRIGTRTLKTPFLWALAATSLLGVTVLEVPFPALISIAALLAWGAHRWVPAWLGAFTSHAKAADSSTNASTQPYLIDDHTPAPSHASWSVPRLLMVLAVGFLLWLLPMLFVFLSLGENHPLMSMGWFFTKAALLTFGGAYAVLPYVYQAAVTQMSWLSSAQMMDGLALGETTPGPLIMVVTFVGFVAGYGNACFIPDAPVLSAVVAACWVTWFTFLPSFVFVLAGGPLIESSHRQPAFQAPLMGITAAIVGVMLQLAVLFGSHVFWPSGLDHALNWWGVAVATLAGLALFMFKRSVMEVIVGCALVGVIRIYI